MSARVWNPMAVSEMAKFRLSTATQKPSSHIISAAKVKRVLFGPVDTEETKIFIERHLSSHTEELSKKYEFDFMAGQPLKNHKKYQWERVPPTSAPACFSGITLSRGAHVMMPSTSLSEDLLDKRAERENGTVKFRYIPVTPASVSGSDSESDCSFDTVRTHPLVLRSETLAITAQSDVVTSTTNATSSSSSFPASVNRAKLQPRITDFLQERKRLSSSSPKSSDAKKARQTEVSSSTSPSYGLKWSI